MKKNVQSASARNHGNLFESSSRSIPPRVFAVPLRGIAVAVVAPFVSDANTYFADNGAPYSINRQSHLGVVGRVNLGSFYTPAKYVELFAEWLTKAHVVVLHSLSYLIRKTNFKATEHFPSNCEMRKYVVFSTNDLLEAA